MTVLAGMLASPDDAVLQKEGCWALMELVRDEWVPSLVDAGALTAVVEALQHFRDSPELVAYACGALASLCRDDGSRMMIGDGPAMKDVIAAMHRFERVKEVQQRGVEALLNIVLDNADNEEQCLALGGMPTVLSAMRAFSELPKLMHDGAWLLMSFSALHPEQRLAMCDEGAVELLLTGLREHSIHADYQNRAIWALLNLSMEESACSLLALLGAAPVLLNSMQLHVGDDGVQHRAAWLLLNMLAIHGEQRDVIGVHSGIPTVLASLAAHPESRGVQQYGIGVLAMMSVEMEWREQACIAGGVEAVLEAMGKHILHEDLVSFGAIALTNLSYSSTGKRRMVMAGAMATLLSMMEVHGRNSEVRSSCMSLFDALCDGDDDLASLPPAVSEGDVAVIVEEEADGEEVGGDDGGGGEGEGGGEVEAKEVEEVTAAAADACVSHVVAHDVAASIVDAVVDGGESEASAAEPPSSEEGGAE
eukprot:PLAT10486.2.p1 GENE.PLAT10486.2~~PLAT10486.2.p1  ORF type:complete len:554 (+),score=216.20 PLAT10486.2:233-1663(+)